MPKALAKGLDWTATTLNLARKVIAGLPQRASVNCKLDVSTIMAFGQLKRVGFKKKKKKKSLSVPFSNLQ
jgi:hypothetical protein